jgi:antitoxin (DNA-binding transcriptional repressor) of toxin-antitoxin stability system
MSIDTGNVVSVKKFHAEFAKYLRKVEKGEGPIALIKDSEVVAYVVPPDHEAYDTEEMAEVLAKRMKGKTYAHEQVMAEARRRIQKARRK